MGPPVQTQAETVSRKPNQALCCFITRSRRCCVSKLSAPRCSPQAQLQQNGPTAAARTQHRHHRPLPNLSPGVQRQC